MNKLLLALTYLITGVCLYAQEDIIINTQGRNSISLNGTWHYIIDPYETGFYDYRFKERNEGDGGAYWNRPVLTKKTDWTEHGYKDPYTIQVPGDWNSQDRIFEYYEGTVWYQREFDAPALKDDESVYLYFGAVNYEAHVYLNGKKLGMHKGGFTPFNFKIPKEVLMEEGNYLVVKVDNKRHPEEIPTVNTDWWNFGGITRDVKLVVVPETFIRQYHVQLDPEQDVVKASSKKRFQIKGWIKLNNPVSEGIVTLEIPELKLKEEVRVTGDSVSLAFEARKMKLWSTSSPKLYEVNLTFNDHTIKDKIGFRKIAVEGEKILLNGKQLFLRGISIHEEIPQEVRRANSAADATQLFGWVKELNANMVRLAHYPHNEYMPRLADSLGILVWTEIPVYWTIDFGNKEVLKKAEKQLEEMISRDRNRASVIIWSVGNETPVSETRTNFMSTLVKKARSMDATRLISAALEVSYNAGVNYVDDPLGAYTDIVSLNEYLGWYGALPDACQTAKWETKYKKPFFISETGAGAKGGFHDVKEMRFSEEFQEWYYKEQVNMFKTRFPANFSGLSPWILADFRSPRRNNPEYQEGWNRKGLIDDKGNKKLAFYILQDYYKEMMEKENN
ncbi:glycoside hydrolase family 2 protein [Robertkochia solimangrovi]|uniref:glycoside hydrolase family 2 protein n=1 Tax=Robertkochia solimangrovi TaxID=2213046 RepID=UPI00117E216E|nr:glycoside hydrolase family 2 TIM barrel-domain containing protein [Robertkochia solimangrovi]TRZ41596.1 beta-glucuronidase [Robertkochia solimangrovi]